jgi:hypothetical protein
MQYIDLIKVAFFRNSSTVLLLSIESSTFERVKIIIKIWMNFKGIKFQWKITKIVYFPMCTNNIYGNKTKKNKRLYDMISNQSGC